MINEHNLHERVVTLEAHVNTLKEILEDIHKDVKETKAEINKYKGLIGSIWFVVSCIGVFFSAMKYFHRG